MFKLLSTATEAVIPARIHDVLFTAIGLTSSVFSMMTSVIVKRAHYLAISSGFSLSSVNRHTRIAVLVCGPGTKLCARSLVSAISHHNHVSTATGSPCRGASSASTSGRHVKRLPAQVVCWVLVISIREEVSRQISVLIKHGKTFRLTGFGHLSFYFGRLKLRQT